MILDAFQKFSADKFKDAQNMQHSLACLVSYELKVPLSFHLLLSKEKVIELARFQDTELLASHLSLKSGYLNDCCDEINLEISNFAADTIGQPFLTLGRFAYTASEKVVQNLNYLASELATEESGYADDVCQDLKLSAEYTAPMGAPTESANILKFLAQLHDDVDYNGVHYPILQDACWEKIVALRGDSSHAAEDLTIRNDF